MRILIPLLIGMAIPLGSLAAAVPTIDYRAPLSDGTTVVGIECHWKKQTLEIANFDSSHPPNRRMDLCSTNDLVVWNDITSDFVKALSVERRCKLGNAVYKVRFTGSPGGSNATRRCGGFVSARATVWKNGRKLFEEEMDECFGKQPGIATVRFTPASDTPVITRQPAR